MSDFIGWMAAEAEPPPLGPNERFLGRREGSRFPAQVAAQVPANLPRHQFPQTATTSFTTENTEGHGVGSQNPDATQLEQLALPSLEVVVDEPEFQRQRRIYRNRTVGMLRRYMRYSIETGRLPSLLGREFFRAKVTSYTVTTFEDRVIFVHDMETSLDKLDEFSQQILARHVLQEHDQPATARLLGCSERTVRTYVPMALDLLGDILLEVGLLERSVSNREKPCQGGNSGPFSASDCEEGENKL
jgi:hypothetical protein